jgi:hypothetical protein
MNQAINENPFERAITPLYAALVPDEIFKGSHFERRFVTPFGKVWERLAALAANEGLGYGITDHTITGTIKEGRLSRISEMMNRLERPGRGASRIRPDWNSEMEYILQGGGDERSVEVVCDVYAEARNADNRRYAFELKAPKPNKDQTKVSKEKILKLYSMDPPQVDGAYFALPYNPFGRRADYSWSFPACYFNMREDPVVLIGDEFWEKLGGVVTYQAILDAANEIGREYKVRIYREYLGIEPPANLKEDRL